MVQRIADHILWRLEHYKRQQLLRALKSVGADVDIADDVVIASPDKCEIGDGVHIMWMTVVYAAGGVTIGAHAGISAHCTIASTTHPLDPIERRTRPPLLAPVRIEADAFLGAGSIVLPGVTIGESAIVGAGAVVTADVAPGTTVVGVPARACVRLVP